MQFIPSAWAAWRVDGTGDGRADPGNIWDATPAAGRCLRAGGRNLAVLEHFDRAVLGPDVRAMDAAAPSCRRAHIGKGSAFGITASEQSVQRPLAQEGLCVRERLTD
ncbi:hypothetical protein [Streptomyces sp. LS1784]|uniref:hypothetical protein n=1 Tax=Streptomyces sp. LS1784 TaxID=2851533 RepID=UPI001CCEE920|nr:hypothetical protein [Streptomyces sp. LS1784]